MRDTSATEGLGFARLARDVLNPHRGDQEQPTPFQLAAEQLDAEQQLPTDQGAPEQLDAELSDACGQFIGRMISHAEQFARRLSIPVMLVKALHAIDAPTAMKEISKRMRCDPSLVTMAADALERHGLARREPHPGDRRIKTIVLTEFGERLRQHIEAHFVRDMPWSTALTVGERRELLRLVRKMLAADSTPDDSTLAGNAPDDRAPANSTSPPDRTPAADAAPLAEPETPVTASTSAAPTGGGG